MNSEESSAYLGPERRRHQTYITRNTEYHLRDEVCVAVRDRQADRWLEEHLAIGHRLRGGVRVLENGEAIPVFARPEVGQALYFDAKNRELITSLLCEVQRPNQSTVASYPPS